MEPEPSDGKKRKRPDVAARLKKRKTQQAQTVTYGFGGRLNSETRKAIENDVNTISVVGILASRLLNLFLLRCVEEGLSPNINAILCYTACSLVSLSQQSFTKKARDQPFLKRVFVEDFLPSLGDFQLPNIYGLTNQLRYLSTELSASYSNYMEYALPTHATWLFRKLYGCSKYKALRLWARLQDVR